MYLPLKPTSPAEVKKIITKLKVRKAPGYNLITAKILKEIPEKGQTFLTSLFNCITRTAYFPKLWKVSQVVMILNPGNPPNEMKSCRAINLLPSYQ